MLSVGIALGTLPVSASSDTMTHYYVNENGSQIKEPTVTVVEDADVPMEFDGYEYLYYAGAVTYRYSKTIEAYVEGYSDGTFKPNKGITRAEAAKMLCRFIDVQGGSESLSPDDALEPWYYEYVSALFKAGYLTGYPDGTFRPNNTMTRAEFIKLIILVGGITGSTDNSYIDVPKSHWAYSYISMASAAELVSGYGDGTFGPDDDITRAEAVTIINRLYDYTAVDLAISSAVNPYSDVDRAFWGYDAIMIASGAIGRSINGTLRNRYIDESGYDFSSLIACFLSDLTAPEVEGYTCIYANIVNNYYYKTAANISQ